MSTEDGEKFFGVPMAWDRKTYEGKAKLVAWFENFKAIVGSLGLCYFISQWTDPYLLNPEDLAKLYSTATGKSINVMKLMEIGERIHNVEKAFNVREGMTRKDDYPPERFFEPIKSGPGKGERLDRKKYEKMLSDYYILRGWHAETGRPTKAKLEALGLNEVVDELGKLGKLA